MGCLFRGKDLSYRLAGSGKKCLCPAVAVQWVATSPWIGEGLRVDHGRGIYVRMRRIAAVDAVVQVVATSPW